MSEPPFKKGVVANPFKKKKFSNFFPKGMLISAYIFTVFVWISACVSSKLLAIFHLAVPRAQCRLGQQRMADKSLNASHSFTFYYTMSDWMLERWRGGRPIAYSVQEN